MQADWNSLCQNSDGTQNLRTLVLATNAMGILGWIWSPIGCLTTIGSFDNPSLITIKQKGFQISFL